MNSISVDCHEGFRPQKVYKGGLRDLFNQWKTEVPYFQSVSMKKRSTEQGLNGSAA